MIGDDCPESSIALEIVQTVQEWGTFFISLDPS